jgi:hypothetical protein
MLNADLLVEMCGQAAQNVRLGGWRARGVAALQALKMTRVQMGAIRQHLEVA